MSEDLPPTLRHQPVHDGFVPAQGMPPQRAAAIDRHIEQHFGSHSGVLHEMLSHVVAVHVHVVGPTAGRPYQTLVTEGMSERPMPVPPGVSPFAEVMLCLPPEWPLDQGAMNDERNWWPIRLLKEIARLPHLYNTWIGAWHSIPNGDPAQPYAPGLPFTGVVVTPMLLVRPEARVIEVGGGTQINLLALVPLSTAEMQVKLTGGTDALIDLLDRGRVNEVLDPTRAPLA